MAFSKAKASSVSNFTIQDAAETEMVIEEVVIETSPSSDQVLLIGSPITPDDSSSDSTVLKPHSQSFMGMPILVSSDSTEIAEEIEVETTPMTSAIEITSNNYTNPFSFGIPTANQILVHSSGSILMRSVEYEDISDDESCLNDNSRYSSEIVSLLTPESTLIEEDRGNMSGDSMSGYSTSIKMTNQQNVSTPIIKSIPVSTIKWAPKATPLPEDVVIIPEKTECPVQAPPICTGKVQEDNEDDEVVFLGEYRPPPKAKLPCFLPCCYNALDNGVIPVRVWHPHRERIVRIQHSTMIPTAQSFIPSSMMQLIPQPSVRQPVQFSKMPQMNRPQVFRKPMIFPEPPKSEWLDVSVYHLDPLGGILRYKCRSCDGLVEQRSFKSRFQFFTQELKHQCLQCEKRYHSKRQLQHHLFRHKERRLPCSFCERKFLTKIELQNHLNTHTRQKTYGCPVCSEAFSHSSRYYSHIRNHHKKYDCEDCFLKICVMPKLEEDKCKSHSKKCNPLN